MKKKFLLLLAMLCVFCMAFCACGAKEPDVAAMTLRVGSLKGPTSMGLVHLMNQNENGECKGSYEFTMETQPDVIMASMIQGNIDIALIPANMAAIMYQKTEGQISVIDINTLGVLYMVSGDTSVADMSSLRGKTIYLTGKGASPEYVLRYLLDANGIKEDEINLEFKSEATEVAAMLAENPDAIGLIPQPFVTVALSQNDALKIVIDLNDEWNKVQDDDGSMLLTGVTVVRNEVLESNPEAVYNFMQEHKASTEAALNDITGTAELVATYGIIEKAPVAEKALPFCNITYIDGKDMEDALSGYLSVLYEQDATSVGGSLPDMEFYLIEN